jgi:protein-L-isoaspartate(D-aspartate) O-methyltransferase
MTDAFESARQDMVEKQIEGRGIRDPGVLQAMRKVARHIFVPEEMKPYSYADEPLPIGDGQTISQPYIVAYMTEVLELKGDEKVLEVGTGSGYQTAILAKLAREVYTIEVVAALSARAEKLLSGLGYTNIHFKIGDGTKGWPEQAPYDAIIVTAAPAEIPEALEEQLVVKGRMVIPVGREFQDLVLAIRKKKKMERKKLISVRFVPLVSGA